MSESAPLRAPGVGSWLGHHRRQLSKVPEIIVLFWVTKILTTGMGEALSDYLVTHMARVTAVAIALIALLAALAWQFWVHRYVVWVYWLAVSLVAVFGTMAADALHVGLGIRTSFRPSCSRCCWPASLPRGSVSRERFRFTASTRRGASSSTG